MKIKSPQEIANELYPDYLMVSNDPYEDDFMKSNAVIRNAFLRGWRMALNSSAPIHSRDCAGIQGVNEEFGVPCSCGASQD